MAGMTPSWTVQRGTIGEMCCQNRWETYGARLGHPAQFPTPDPMDALWSVGGGKKAPVAGSPVGLMATAPT
jgi:hypothetical protein